MNTKQRCPATAKNGRPGDNRKPTRQDHSRKDGGLATIIDNFIHKWDDAARRFLAALWQDPRAGVPIALAVGVDPSCFPRPDLYDTAEVLADCGEAGVRRPSAKLLIDHAACCGRCVHGGNIAELDFLVREVSDAGLKAYARELVDFARRRRLVTVLYRGLGCLLDPLEDVDQTISTTIRALTEAL